MQGLPVMFCIDRAGLVGGDGAVHHGFLDITYLRGFPNMTLIAPMDEVELRQALRFALTLDHAAAVRYPRDDVPAPMPDCPPFEYGRSRRLRDGEDATILAYGVTAGYAMTAAELLAEGGISAAVVNARFAKPVDADMVRDALVAGGPIVTVEDHSIAGGFGSAVLETVQELYAAAANRGAVGDAVETARKGEDDAVADRLPAVVPPIVRLGLPVDRFIAHGSRPGQLAECGIDATGIAETVQRLVDGASEDGGASRERTPRTSRTRGGSRAYQTK